MINRIGRYEIQAELGRGGFGRVFRAYDPTVGRLVAIKTLNTSTEQDLLTRFRNEAAAAGKLHHPNIVIVHDFGEHDGSPFLVLELLDGEDIERIISTGRDLPLLKRIDVMMQSAAGLHHAHTKGVVHRDVKPANIMLLANGSVKLMDFGIALLSQATADRITPQGSLVGTLPYMAPEQFFGAGSSVLTDIFAYGVTSYRLLTGTHPFQAGELGSMMHNIANRPHAPIRSFQPQYPEALETIVDKLLAKKPETRYQSLEDVQLDLEPIILALRRENVGELLVETRRLIAADELESAQSMVRQIIEIDPRNRTARELRDAIHQQLKDRVVRPRINALVSAGRDQLQAGNFDGAMRSFESALRLDTSNSELRELLKQAEATAERAGRVDGLIRDAREALRREDLTAAHKNIMEALAADPDNSHADELRIEVGRRLELRQRDQVLHDGLNELRHLMALQNFSAAIESAARLRKEFPDSSECQRILERAQHEQEAQLRRQQLQNAIAEARALIKSRCFAEAAEHLSRVQQNFPESSDLRDLASHAAVELQAEKEAAAIARIGAQTGDLVTAGKFDAALDRLESALREYPGAHSLRELVQSVSEKKAEHQRKKALDEALLKSKKLLTKERFPEVVECLESFVRAYGENSAVVAVRRVAEEGIERRRQTAAIAKVVQDAQARLDEGNPDEASRILHQAAVQFPGNAQVAGLLSIAEKKLRVQRQMRELSGEEVREPESISRVEAARPSRRLLLTGGIGIATLGAGIGLFHILPFHTQDPPKAVNVTPAQPPQLHVNDEPKPPEPPPPTRDVTTPQTGMLEVRTGVPGASVYVDGAARGRTDQSGSAAMVLEARKHDVRVERNGYQNLTPQRVTIVAGSRGVMSFRMVPEAMPSNDKTPPAANVKPATTPAPEITEKETAGRTADLAWNAVDQNNIEAVRKFVRDYPSNPHIAEARRVVERYDAEQQRTAQERVAQEQARQEQLKQDLARRAQLDQERSRVDEARKQVLSTLQQLDSALQRKRTADVKALWPGASPTFFESMKSGQVEMSLTVEDVQFLSAAETAVAHCVLVIRTRARNAPAVQHPGTMNLRKTGGTWFVEAARFN